MTSPFDWSDDELTTPAKPLPVKRPDPRATPLTRWDKMLRSLGLRYASVCPACNGMGHLTITQRTNT